MLSFGNEMLWRHRARDFDAVIEYYINPKSVIRPFNVKSKIQASPNDRFGLNGLMTVRGLISKKNRLAFTCNSLTKGVSLHYIKYVT